MNDLDPVVGIPEPPELQQPIAAMRVANQNLWQFPKRWFDKIWQMDFSNITIAILDTGYVSHPDLPEPIYAESQIRGQTVRDRNGHGTHCAGTALGRNGIGFCHNAKFICIKVLSDQGSGASSGIAAGIDSALKHGADVISLSLGGGSPYQPTAAAGKRAADAGAVLVAAAGNAGRGGDGYPARFDDFHSIGALEAWDRRAPYSSIGRSVDIMCPGSNILSASHRGGHVRMNGTSMATPWAAGMWGAILSQQRREGHSRIVGTEAQHNYMKGYLKDLGRPGRDTETGDGVPDPLKVLSDLVGDEGELS